MIFELVHLFLATVFAVFTALASKFAEDAIFPAEPEFWEFVNTTYRASETPT